jgi:peroxiredoxin
MKLIAPSLVFAAACAAALILPRARAAAEAGAPAPDFTVTDVAGKTHTLAGYRGKVVVLEWLSPGCPFVVRHYKSGNMQSTQAAAAADGTVWLQINSSAVGDMDPAKSAEWQKKQGVTAAAYIRDSSGKLGRLYGARTTPHLYVIARDGILAYQGAIDDQPNASVLNTMAAHNYVKAALASLKAGQPVAVASTPPYGCGVKYGGGD